MLLNAWKDNPALSRVPSPWRVLSAALLLAFLSFAARELNSSSWNAGGVTILWATNGLLLGILLCNPKRHWPLYLAVAAVIDVFVNRSMGSPLHIAWYLSACNLAEATIGALLLYETISPKPDLTQRKQLVAFLAYGVVLAPLLASFAASFAQSGYFAPPTFFNVQRWFAADALGIATVTPLYLAFQGKERFGGRPWLEIVGLFALLLGVTWIVCWQSRFPLLFVVLPFLLLLGLRFRLAGSALGLLLVAIIG